MEISSLESKILNEITKDDVEEQEGEGEIVLIDPPDKTAMERINEINSVVPLGNVVTKKQMIGGKEMEVVEEYIGPKGTKERYVDAYDDPIE